MILKPSIILIMEILCGYLTKEGIIPVDSKFSLDNYERLIHEPEGPNRELLEKEFKNDLKKRIDETAKYIKPDEGTLEFAFMYISI